MSHGRSACKSVPQCLPLCHASQSAFGCGAKLAPAPIKAEPVFQDKSFNDERPQQERLRVNSTDHQFASVIKHAEEQHAEVMRGMHKIEGTLQQTMQTQHDRLELQLEQLFAKLCPPESEEDYDPGAGNATVHTAICEAGAVCANQTLASTGSASHVRSAAREEHLRNFHLANRWHTFAQPWEEIVQEEEESNGDLSDRSPSAQTAPWVQFVTSTKFDMISGVLVLINCIGMAMHLEYIGIQANALLNNRAKPVSGLLSNAFRISEHVFCGIFTIELFLRILAYGRSWIRFSNILDFFVVLLSILENYVFSTAGVQFPNVSALRLLRLTRLVKAVRVLRVMQAFHPLRVLVLTISSSVGALGWSMILLTLLQFMTSIGMTQLMQDLIMDESKDLQLRKQIYEYFGKWSYSMLTMFEITVAPGGWVKIGRIIIMQVSEWYAVFFMVYVWLVTFAIIRVITAIFLRQTMAVASRDHEVTYHERVMKHDRDVLHLKKIFEEGDKDTCGSLTRKAFDRVLKDSRVVTWLAELELEVSEVRGLFWLLDNGDGLLSFEEFMSGVLRLRGAARNVDLITLLYENKKIHLELLALREALGFPINSVKIHMEDLKHSRIHES